MNFRSTLQMLRDYRSFDQPFVVLASRLNIFRTRYCSCDVTAHGQHYRVLARPHAGDPSLLREVLTRQTYAPILPYLPARPLKVVDVGAHIGMFTLWLSRHAEIASVTCFEPDPESARLCRFNLASVPQASVRPVAVGATARQATIHIDPHGSARSTLVANLPGREPNRQTATTEVIAFGEFMQALGPIDLLKLDCEGSEWELVRQCPQIFKDVATIVAELHDDPAQGGTHEDFRKMMRAIGCRLIPADPLFLAVGPTAQFDGVK